MCATDCTSLRLCVRRHVVARCRRREHRVLSSLLQHASRNNTGSAAPAPRAAKRPDRRVQGGGRDELVGRRGAGVAATVGGERETSREAGCLRLLWPRDEPRGGLFVAFVAVAGGSKERESRYVEFFAETDPVDLGDLDHQADLRLNSFNERTDEAKTRALMPRSKNWVKMR